MLICFKRDKSVRSKCYRSGCVAKEGTSAGSGTRPPWENHNQVGRAQERTPVVVSPLGKNPQPLSQLQCSREPSRFRSRNRMKAQLPTTWFRLRKLVKGREGDRDGAPLSIKHYDQRLLRASILPWQWPQASPWPPLTSVASALPRQVFPL